MVAPADAADFRALFPPSAYPEFEASALDDAIDTALAVAKEYVETLRPRLDPAGNVFAGAVGNLAAHMLTTGGGQFSQSNGAGTASEQQPVYVSDELAGTQFGRNYKLLTRGRKTFLSPSKGELSVRAGFVPVPQSLASNNRGFLP